MRAIIATTLNLRNIDTTIYVIKMIRGKYLAPKIAIALAQMAGRMNGNFYLTAVHNKRSRPLLDQAMIHVKLAIDAKTKLAVYQAQVLALEQVVIRLVHAWILSPRQRLQLHKLDYINAQVELTTVVS
jgi:hypothetical protein